MDEKRFAQLDRQWQVCEIPRPSPSLWNLAQLRCFLISLAFVLGTTCFLRSELLLGGIIEWMLLLCCLARAVCLGHFHRTKASRHQEALRMVLGGQGAHSKVNDRPLFSAISGPRGPSPAWCLLALKQERDGVV